jgi:hypothetical protein
MPTRGRPARVLILSDDPMSAALLGLLLETGAYEPTFDQPGEAPEEALNRVRPLWVILLDGAMRVARSDLFYTRAERRGVRVILWSGASASADVAAIAQHRGLLSFTVPVTRAELVELLERAEVGKDRRSSREDRREPSVTPAGDRLLFTDALGRRWYVYDRRSADRRTDTGRTEDAVSVTARVAQVYRAFVNDAGEEWWYGFAPGEATDATPATLERQLAGAVRVGAP